MFPCVFVNVPCCTAQARSLFLAPLPPFLSQHCSETEKKESGHNRTSGRVTEVVHDGALHSEATTLRTSAAFAYAPSCCLRCAFAFVGVSLHVPTLILPRPRPPFRC